LKKKIKTLKPRFFFFSPETNRFFMGPPKLKPFFWVLGLEKIKKPGHPKKKKTKDLNPPKPKGIKPLFF